MARRPSNPPPIKSPSTNNRELDDFLAKMADAVYLLWKNDRDPDIGTSLIATFASLGIASDPPASAADTGTAGTITWDAGFIYVCVATDTWKRVAIATW
jgi:hypothetical protein